LFPSQIQCFNYLINNATNNTFFIMPDIILNMQGKILEFYK